MKKIENKEMLLYSVEKAVNEAIEEMNCKCSDEKEVYYRVGTALHWIINCLERAYNVGINFSKEDIKLRSALKGANNALKHKAELVQLHEKISGAKVSFPMGTPLAKLGYFWREIDDIDLECKSQKKNYKNIMEGKDIDVTLKKAREIVNKYFAQSK